MKTTIDSIMINIDIPMEQYETLRSNESKFVVSWQLTYENSEEAAKINIEVISLDYHFRMSSYREDEYKKWRSQGGDPRYEPEEIIWEFNGILEDKKITTEICELNPFNIRPFQVDFDYNDMKAIVFF